MAFGFPDTGCRTEDAKVTAVVPRGRWLKEALVAPLVPGPIFRALWITTGNNISRGRSRGYRERDLGRDQPRQDTGMVVGGKHVDFCPRWWCGRVRSIEFTTVCFHGGSRRFLPASDGPFWDIIRPRIHRARLIIRSESSTN